MKLLFAAYLELPAPLQTSLSYLSRPASWAAAFEAEPLGDFWRYGSELYRLSNLETSSPTTLRWLAAPVAGNGAQLELSLTLHDAQIATHVDLRLSLSQAGLPLPWRKLALQRALRRATNAAASRLSELLRAETTRTLINAQSVAAGLDDEHEAALSGVLADLERLEASPAQMMLVEQLFERYPQTVEQFVAMGALDHLERAARLEQSWEQIMQGAYDPAIYQLVAPETLRRKPTAQPSTNGQRPPQHGPPQVGQDFDLIYAGGGLGLMHAAVMAACYGQRVLIFDRSEVGCAHREWNITRSELDALVLTGVVSWAEIEQVIMRTYRDGLVRFHNRPGSGRPEIELRLPGVLDVALDAGGLLRLLRRKLEAAGGVVLSRQDFHHVRTSSHGPVMVEVTLEDVASGTVTCYTAHLLLDGMGSTSPLALLRHQGLAFASICPTVGSVASGFVEGDDPSEVNLELGEILTSVADTQCGEQLMWEGFPGRGDELTVYLFYYSTIAAEHAGPSGGLHPDAPRYSLLDLFEQYFTLLPSYKRPGPRFRHLRPVYGYIPGRHSLRPHEAPLLRGVLPVGDSAAQQSPLTFCGFGSHVRNLRRTTDLLAEALENNLLEPQHLALINAFQTNVSLHWVFSRFMQPWGSADDVNLIQNIFLQVLQELGFDLRVRFYRDQMRWSDFNPILLKIYQHWPQVLGVAWRVLGPRSLASWAGDYMRFSGAAAAASLARLGGRRAEAALIGLSSLAGPAARLRLRARYEEWRAMGWIAF